MFNEFLTTEGERLLAKSIAGTATITFTKMELGDGDRGTASKNITSLESKRMTLDIYSVQLSGDNHVTITSILKSENIEAGFYYREKAVYATDGTTEILFMYGTAGSLAEWIENSKTSVFERTIRTIIAFSEGDNISVTIQGGAYASGEDAKNILTAIQNIKLDGDWATQSQAESILYILDTFVAAYTTLRAGKLDNLDALVSSRAPANTALSNATWTNARAAVLDNLDAKISSRAVASTALSNATWTDARAAKQDNLDTTISSRAAASTALSNAVWTNARAGYLDNLPSILNNINTTLSGMNTIQGANGYYKPSGTLRHTIVSSRVQVENKVKKVGGFYAAKSGCIRVYATFGSEYPDCYACLFIPKYDTGAGKGVEPIGSPCSTAINFLSIENGVELTIDTMKYLESINAVAIVGKTTSEVSNVDTTVWVERGQYIAFYLGVSATTRPVSCTALNVYYDEVV